MLDTGTKIAGYRVERLLGSGGMGTVYLATQESLNRPVALKLLSQQLTADETFRARFRREGEVQAALDHPHIVPVYEAGEAESGLFLAMRYVRGSTLKDLVDTGDLDPARTLRLLTPVAGALDAAHAAGLIHRDVKPQNILVDQTDWPYLADFGLTRGGASGPTRTGQLVGTFAYIAPEQIKGERASARSDQYALAAVLFECLAGEAPHNHESDAALLYAKVHEEPPRLSSRAADLPRGFDEVLARGMAREPGDRYASSSALLAAATDALERAEAGGPSAPTVAAPVMRAPAPTPAPKAAPPPPPPPPPAAPAPPAAVPPRAPGSPAQHTVLVDTLPPIDTPRRPERTPKPPRPPRQPRAPREPREPRERREPRTAPAFRIPAGQWVVPAAALVAAAIGFGIGGALAGDPAKPPARVAAGELGTIEIPAALRSARGPAGLGLQSLRAYSGAGRRAAVVGSGRPSGPSLLPPGALADAARAANAPTVVRVGSAQALRFENLVVPGLSGRTQMVSLPTADGVLVAACAAPTARDETCASLLGSLAPRGGAKPAPVAASPEYADAIRRRLAAYDSARTSATRLLRSAGRSATQAQAARRLATAAGTLVTDMNKLDTAPGARPAHDALVSAARRLRSASRRLASAASSRSQTGYRRAAADVERADSALRAAVKRLRQVYRRT
ncbi:MAG TPA: serine/threonine-protein kinase [Solirubrobacteraceae bacterium]|nr:serine/threonine-protein kinase [Solirubrobacteraceae bacterium]